ncbi:multidrug efflux RND transporter permease subunit [Persicobacter psychrovividus]|uniref:Multidrug efflux RND transporter permease subunit n=1 Tax=Persicobacter psychrovividus TaxID=387638 RepID=A0ABM7VIT8_9BACT|nr:multidrug efflux RND transporter permease subunit [Persicobacter psychrovividus]
MKPSFFIDRPIFSAVISILIVLLGVLAITQLPVAQYPDITPPVVRVSTNYPGANAKVVNDAIASELEQQLNGTPNMISMKSKSSNTGGLNIQLTFRAGTDADLSAIEVRNRVKRAESKMPAEVMQGGITVEKQAVSKILTLSLTSSDPKFDEIYLSNFATINVLDPLKRVPGVAGIWNVGSRYYSMRIWIQPDRLAAYGLTVRDLSDAIKEQNRESAAGELGIQPLDHIDVTLPITARGRMSTKEEFENIIVRANLDGSFIRIRDVARVELAASSYRQSSELNGKNAAMMEIYLLEGANALQVANNVRSALKELKKSFPEGIDYKFSFDATQFISASIDEVYVTLIEAIILVILVVYLSLQSWRSALVPTIAVPISLIGTFAVMLVFGFSLNILTLLGLILAIGIVVDDAIVVVENVERIMEEEGLEARPATHKAMGELVGALITTSLVLAAVFVPVSFLGGITGTLFKQFSITIAVSVLLSTVVALTLSPALCAILLKPKSGNQSKIFKKIDHWVNAGNSKYTQYVRWGFEHRKRMFAGFGMAIIFTGLLAYIIPTSFIPGEDQGYFDVEIALPDGASLTRTSEVVNRAQQFILKNPAVANIQTVKGLSHRVGGTESRGVLTVILKPWDERKGDNMSIDHVIADLRKEFYKYPEANVFITKPSEIPGLGDGGGFEFQLQSKSGNSLDKLVDAADSLVAAASKRKELSGVNASMQPKIPQLYFDLDRDRAKFLGVPIADVFSTMNAFLGSQYVNDFNKFNRVYRVNIMAEQAYRKNLSDLNLFFVRTSNGTMVPVSALGAVSMTTGPGSLNRFNMFLSTTIHGTAAPGYSSGQAMKAMEEVAAKVLPEGMGFEWSGMSYEEKQAEGQLGPMIAIVVIFVFLFLAAQYESWIIPIAVLITLPIAIFGAFLGVWFRGLENDIYFQIGMISLIGLSAKNAILIVEFAKEKMTKEGLTAGEAALQAASLRFRPILMTSLAFVLGMIPLVMASGAGAAARHSIGTGVFTGMILATTVGIVYIPLFFKTIVEFQEKVSARFSKDKNQSK